MRWRLKTESSTEPIDVTLLSQEDDTYVFQVGSERVTLRHPEVFPFSINTDETHLTFEAWGAKKWRAVSGSETFTIEPLAWGAASVTSQTEIRSDMPGRILKVLVKAGDRISEKQPLLIMEAMKMENEIRATGDCVVKSVAVEAGQSVESGALLIELE